MIVHADSLRILPLADESVDCCVTSPPYWGLRDYGVDGQLGLEKTPEEYVAKLVAVFREVWRVLRNDGTVFLNLGDCYAARASGGRVGEAAGKHAKQVAASGVVNPPNRGIKKRVTKTQLDGCGQNQAHALRADEAGRVTPGLKPKDLVGIPWRVAFALQADGWWLRSDIIWHKSNGMPESVQDRPTRAHEYIFLLSKSERYYYDCEAIKEPAVYGDHPRNVDCQPKAPGQKAHTGIRKEGLDKQRGHGRRHAGFNGRWDLMTHHEQRMGIRNKRDVWCVATRPNPLAHFAAFPPALITPCILAGCREGGIVFDPFVGTGTTVQVAQGLGRKGIGCDLNWEYCEMAMAGMDGQMTLQLANL